MTCNSANMGLLFTAEAIQSYPYYLSGTYFSTFTERLRTYIHNCSRWFMDSIANRIFLILTTIAFIYLLVCICDLMGLRIGALLLFPSYWWRMIMLVSSCTSWYPELTVWQIDDHAFIWPCNLYIYLVTHSDWFAAMLMSYWFLVSCFVYFCFCSSYHF
jgi:hypothetical protein